MSPSLELQARLMEWSQPYKVCYYTIEVSMAQLRITYRTYVTGPEANGAEGPCGDEARRSAEEPEAPSEAPKHIRAVMCSASSGHSL